MGVALFTRHATREEFIQHRDEARVVREQRYRSVYAVRDWFLVSVNRTVPQPVSALIGGVLVGARSQLPKDIVEDFRRTGLSHIMAISGYNISIISVILMNMLASLISRRRAFWAVLGILLVFTILTGLQASVIRAAIMGLFALFAQHMGRVPTPMHALVIAAAIMVGFDPLILRFDIGFQLSVLATLGILTLAPRLQTKFPEVVAVTISAQLFVLPLIIYYFHTISLISLPANILILPLIPALMLLGFAAGMTSWIPLIGPVVGFLAWTLGKMILLVVHWFASIPWASISL
ncbi:MAG: ComEC/Rec2 family competence protein [Patescibacteria group bacterium]